VHRIRKTALVAALLLYPAVSASAQAQRASAPVATGIPDSALLADFRFRNIGPAVMSGRVADIAVPSASRPGERLGKTIYVATAAGGVWKTTNGGVTWTPIFDAQKVSSTGAVAVAPSNANIVWVGSGESNNLRSSSWGDGIYKSTDAGRTFTHMGLRASQHIARIIIHPTNPEIVYVAASGPLWDKGGERGVYKTTDGGRTWTNVKALGPFTGFTDIAFDPSNPNTLYGASYQRERKAYSFVSGGPESGVWKSTDAGATWTELTNGLPSGDMGRIGIAVARSQPNTIYAAIDANDGGIFRSDDGGATWTRRSNTRSGFAWFVGQLRVDPNNPERIYMPDQALRVSDDGGRTFRNIANQTHADHHAMWIDPNDSDHLMIGNDGGFYISHDMGQTWDFALNLPISTFYAIAVDMRDPYWVYGGLQDNGTWGVPTATRTSSGITSDLWIRTGGGDGFYPAVDPTDHNVIYAESQNGALTRFDFATRESKPIRPQEKPGENLRYNWSAPLLISPHDNRTLWFGAQLLFKSTNRGDSWERVSGDLTRALDRDRLPIMGLNGPGGFGRHAGTAEFGNLATIDESKIRKGLLYTGSDDGVVAVSRDGGANWNKIERFPGVPDMTYVSRVIASQHAEGTAYATFDGHRSNDFKPYVYKSTDFGRTWTSITSNLPEGSVYVIREHHRDPNLLVVGAEYGVFVTLNGGQSWTQMKNGIAPAPVHDLIIHPRANDIVVGTHGRGIYVLEDIAALERLGSQPVTTAKVIPARPAVIQNQGGGFRLPGNRAYAGANPPAGAPLTYVVGPNAPSSARATLTILDAQNRVVRELPASLTPGAHRVYWDMRHASPVARDTARPQQQRPPDEEGGFAPQGPAGGPYVVPATYTVQLKADGRVLSQNTVQIKRDPLLRYTDVEIAPLYTARQRAYDLQVRANRMVGQLDEAKRKLADVLRRDSTAALRTLDAELDSTLTTLRGPRQEGGGGRGGRGGGGGGGGGGAGGGLLGRVNGVASQINERHFLPTTEHLQTLTEASAELDRLRVRVDAIVARVNRSAQSGAQSLR
jgi:photosystem II stability/assembly factor-like uncharacterized protein